MLGYMASDSEKGVFSASLNTLIEKVGKHSYAFSDIQLHSWGEGAKLYVGSFTTIAQGLQVMLGGNHRTDWFTTYPFGHTYTNIFNKFDGNGHPKTNGNVLIGNDVWIGRNVTIMSGVHIGDGAVIACNSHVVKNVAPYTIVGGNPAKMIRKRFSDDIIDLLLQLKWWEWPDEEINEATPILCSSDIEALKKLVRS
jgi:acetyltransferase-like isoleucine patch superfamily enzyme